MKDCSKCRSCHMQTVVFYQTPEGRLQDLKEVLVSRLLPILNIRHSNVIIIWDFNLDIQTGNDNFLRLIEDKFKCKQVVSNVTTNYGSLLDLIFVKVNSDVNIETDVVEAYCSDHKIVYTAVDFWFHGLFTQNEPTWMTWGHITLHLQCDVSILSGLYWKWVPIHFLIIFPPQNVVDKS